MPSSPRTTHPSWWVYRSAHFSQAILSLWLIPTSPGNGGRGPLLSLVNYIPVRPYRRRSRSALMIRAVESGSACVIFPEGRITVYGLPHEGEPEGPAVIAELVHARRWCSSESRVRSSRRSRACRARFAAACSQRFPIHISPARRLSPPEGLVGRARRAALRRALGDEMVRSTFEAARVPHHVVRCAARGAPLHGGGHVVADDIEQARNMTHQQDSIHGQSRARRRHREADARRANGSGSCSRRRGPRFVRLLCAASDRSCACDAQLRHRRLPRRRRPARATRDLQSC